MTNRHIFGLLFTGIIGIAACLYPENHPGLREYKEMARIPVSDEVARRNKFDSFDLDTQINVYLFAQCCVEPSDATILTLLERDGKAKVARIVERIQVSNSGRDKTNLMRLLVRIDIDCKCVSNDSAVVRLLQASRSEIHETDDEVIRLYKTSFNNYLSQLEERK